MLYFPVLKGTYPTWLPIWGGEDFEFFRPVFNLADAAISGGVISIFVFQGKMLSKGKTLEDEIETNVQSNTETETA
jgi:signal peptidase II